MAACIRCGKDASGLLSSFSFNKQTSRCNKCETETQQALGRFRDAFLGYTRDGTLTDFEWQTLIRIATDDRLNPHEAMAFIQNDILQFLDRILTFAASDGVITDQEQAYILKLKNQLGISDVVAQPLLHKMSYLRHLTHIRQGNLPTVTPSVRLEITEICHLETPATLHKQNAKGPVPVHGRLLVTNRKIYFLAPTGGNEVTWSSVMRVLVERGGVFIEASKKSGTGFYTMSDPWLAEAIMDTALRISKREILNAGATKSGRQKIPQEVRAAVWQRDGGRCVECGRDGENSDLEFDHIIPVSKGGATSVQNLQLLCRRCNLKKSDRI